MVQLGCFFHQNISFTLKIGGRIESKIKVKMYAQEDTAAATGTIDAKEIKRSFASCLYMDL